jgi:leader peptidase (prepilin peptidase)/N-methyltransferase
MEPARVVPFLFVVAAGLPAGVLSARVARRFDAALHGAAGRLATGGLAAAFLWACVVVPAGWVLVASCGLAWALFTLAVIDVRIMRLPDALTLPLVVAGLAASALLPGRPILDHLAGAALGYGGLAALAWAFQRVRGREGVGLGDAKLLAAAGAWLGWAALPSALLIACLAAFAWIAARRLVDRRHAVGAPVAFGAPLALGFWVVWLHGPLTL